MSIFSYLNSLAYFGVSPKLPHFDNQGFSYGFEGKSQRAKIEDVCLPKQVHGTELIDANRLQSEGGSEGDAIFTSGKQVVGVVTADCLPILIGAGDGSVVMAIHAGWRGTAQGILLRSIVALKRQHNVDELLVGIGPCIGPAKFEVGPEVIAAIKNGPLDFTESELMSVLTKGKDDRWHLDLAVAACVTLAKNGVSAKNVGVIRSCTHENASFWHSYRRDGKKAGRNLSWIQCP